MLQEAGWHNPEAELRHRHTARALREHEGCGGQLQVDLRLRSSGFAFLLLMSLVKTAFALQQLVACSLQWSCAPHINHRQGRKLSTQAGNLNLVQVQAPRC